MIDIKSGCIPILKGGIIVSSRLKKKQLLSSRLFGYCIREQFDAAYVYSWFYFKPITIFGLQVSLIISFKKEKMHKLEMYVCEDTNLSPWISLSEDSLLARKKLHDSLLKQIFDRDADVFQLYPSPSAVYSFGWGDVCSVLDKASGESLIVVDYKK